MGDFMTRFFTVVSALLLLAVAAAHAYRLYSHISVVVGRHDIPLWVSWPGAIVAGFLAIMLLVESRR
jgi:hypothetical protein